MAPFHTRPELKVRANSKSSLKRTAGSQSVHFNGLSLLAPNSFEGFLKRSKSIIYDQIPTNSQMKTRS
jgi:hypothetical protein